MTSTPLLPPELLAPAQSRWDLIVNGLLATLLVFMPLAFGAVDAWSELIVVILAASLSLVIAIRAAVDRAFYVPWTWAYVPLALFALLAAFQMTPLPQAWLAVLSTSSATVRDELLGPDDAAMADSTISMYPHATAHALRLTMVGIAVFIAVIATYRSGAQIEWLLLVVFLVGCAEASLALLQIATRTDKLYWAIDPGTGTATSGSFVNHSNFSQFMNLSIGAGAALLLMRLDSERSRVGRQDQLTSPFVGASLRQHGGLFAGLALCVAAVIASQSRGGVISLVVAAAIAGGAIVYRGMLGQRALVLVLVPLPALAVVAALGFDATFDQRDDLASRWELTKGTLRAWQAFPVWGAGLETHEHVFPMFDPSATPQLAEHADNDYAQLLEETGVAGALLLAAFIAVIGGGLVRLCRRGRSTASTASFGLALGLFAVAIHGGSDFGQRLPAVFCLSAVLCGLVVQLDSWEREACDAPSNRSPVAVRRGVAVAAVVGLAAAWAWALRDAYATHVSEQWWATALQLEEAIHQAGPDARDEDFADLLAAMEQAVQCEPRNVHYAYWLNAFRWQAIVRRVDADSGRVELSADARPHVQRIADELASVRQLCPTFGPPYALEGQLRLSILGEPRGADLMSLGVRLAPYDAPTCLAGAEAAARDGRDDDAASLLRRAVTIAPALFPDAASIALVAMNRPDLSEELAGDDFRRLEQLSALVAASDEHAALANGFRAKSVTALRRRVASDGAQPAEIASLAAIEVRRGAHDAAIDLYFDALNADYGRVDWRLARANSLVAVGRDEEALQEARRCLRHHPGHEAATKLVEDLELRSE